MRLFTFSSNQSKAINQQALEGGLREKVTKVDFSDRKYDFSNNYLPEIPIFRVGCTADRYISTVIYRYNLLLNPAI